MEFKKCDRCGNFFASTKQVCFNCTQKDNVDISKLQNYFEVAEEVPNIQNLSYLTGITEKNLNRQLRDERVSKIGEENLLNMDQIIFRD